MPQQAKKDVGIFLSIVNFILWSNFHMIMLCARFNFWLHNDEMYVPYRIDSNDGMVWVNPDTFFYETKTTLSNAECKYSIDHPQGYTVVNDNPCNFLFIYISVFLMKEGEVKFSIGCALIIYLLFQALIVYLEIRIDKKYERAENFDSAENVVQPGSDTTLKGRGISFLKFVNPIRSIPLILTSVQQNAHKWVIKYILTTLINSQQSLVILPLTNMSTNPYCVRIVTPTYDENAVCLYKYAAYALPDFFIYGLSAILGYFVFLVFASCGGDAEDGKCRCFLMFLAFCAAVGTALCAFLAAAFLVYYLFAGIFVGLWFQYGVFYWALQTSRPEFLSISLFIFGEILWAIMEDTN